MSNVIRSISQVGTSEPFELQVARGQIPGHSVRNIFGFNAAIGTTLITPWELANTSQLPVPGSALTFSLVSSSASDTSVSILVSGVNADYVLTQEVVALNGTTPVNTTNTYRFINDLITTSGNAVGNVTASNGGTVYAQITAGRGKNQCAAYMVPAGYSFYLTRIDAFSGTATGASKYVNFRNRTTGPDGRIFNVAQTTFGSRMDIGRQLPFKVSEKTLLELQVSTNSTTADIGVFSDGYLIKEQGPAFA